MIRVGLSYDAHAFDESRPLVLGGVTIPDAPGLAGHSDADVVSHAIADALLGAARLGDLGTLFPNDDRWRGASSLDILVHTAKAVSDAGWSIVNADATILAEVPKLAPYREHMIDLIAAALGLATSAVWVKATTTDGLGFSGRREGIAAMAVVLIERPDAVVA
ncbi:MAG: 2-C-methyl-D-erythritol 2,4-cyclodiphosphate synthase [Actinomycetota bacterium]|nr:2-C-methyl-D-erythritol 2,4-cyclodiphosphate synthase [Actinomycetota bacterium]